MNAVARPPKLSVAVLCYNYGHFLAACLESILASDLTDLEAPLVSREIARLCEDGYVKRASDPTDGRATIVTLSAKGAKAYTAYREATDQIVIEAFAGWKAPELRTLADYLERVVHDVSRPPDSV